MTSSMGGLAQRLVSEQLIQESVARNAMAAATSEHIPLVRALVEKSLVNSNQLAQAASREFGVPLLDLNAFDFEQLPQNLVSLELLRKHGVLPLLHRANRLVLAVADPANVEAQNEIKFHTGIGIDVVVVAQDQLHEAIGNFLEQAEENLQGLMQLDDIELAELQREASDNGSRKEQPSDADETPIVRFVNKVLLDAIRYGASDIHIEPFEKSCRVRFRRDGILYEVTRPPQGIAARLASRVKVMANLDISEKRLPQDGRVRLKLSTSRSIDFRVNTLPTLWGEKIVLRLLDPDSVQLGINALGMAEDQKALYRRALQRHQGLILVTGPTGSGKTMSLYSGLGLINTPERNICTAEDPIEINLEGINQVSINARAGLDFATALRAFLRQDPDVLMVGEIRDRETAEIAVKAAQTGHLVMSTLHTNSAAETLTRLLHMGIPAFNLATSLSLLVAQRLLRRLCAHCKENLELPEKVLRDEGFSSKHLEGLTLFRPVGCEHCKNGYQGRVGIYEVVPINAAMSRLIIDGAGAMAIAERARQDGFSSLRQSALRQVARGLSSLEEANRLS